MRKIKNLDLLIKTKLFVFLILNTNYNYANTTPKTTSSSKVEVTTVNTHVEKTKQAMQPSATFNSILAKI